MYAALAGDRVVPGARNTVVAGSAAESPHRVCPGGASASEVMRAIMSSRRSKSGLRCPVSQGDRPRCDRTPASMAAVIEELPGWPDVKWQAG